MSADDDATYDPDMTLDDAEGVTDNAFMTPNLARYAQRGDGDVDEEDGGDSDAEFSDSENDQSENEEMLEGAMEEDRSGAAVEHVSVGSGDEDGPGEDDEETAAEQDDLRTVFPVSRVRELIKYGGSSTIVSREAAQTMTEAVALMLQDLARTAAAEATRGGRRTVTYDDLARVAQLHDRFAYCAELLPPGDRGAGGARKAAVRLQARAAPHPASAVAGPASGGRGRGRGRGRIAGGNGRSGDGTQPNVDAATALSPSVATRVPAVHPYHPLPPQQQQRTLRF